MNIFALLEEAATKWKDDVAVIHRGRDFSYSDLHAKAESLAVEMRNSGIQNGDKVGLMCPDVPEYLTAFFGICKVGGIVVPISPAFKAAELMNLTEETHLEAFCYSPRFRPLIPASDENGSVDAPMFSNRAPLRIQLASNREGSQNERKPLLQINAASIRFTSGTTAKAKGIVLSHDSILARIRAKGDLVATGKSDTILYLLSTGRSIPSRLLVCLSEGAKIVAVDAMNPSQIMSAIERHAVTQVYAAPLFYRMALTEEQYDAGHFSSVKYFLTTASALPKATADAFHRRFGHEIVQYYTLGEVGSPLVNFGDDLSKRGSVGTQVSDYEIKIVPLNAGSSGEQPVGEIYVRGPGMFDAYYKPWRLRNEILEDGWFRTGDVARRDRDGYFWIVGRLKDVINVGGVKVFSSEIEEILLSHPAVDEAVVSGRPDARFGEVPHAKVKLASGAECTEHQLLQDINQSLSVFKALRSVEFVDELPKTMTGKVKRIT